MNIDLKEKLPKFLTDIYEVGHILDSITKEINRLNENVDKTYKNLSIKQCQDHFEWWERDLSINAEDSKSLSDRKKAILANMALFMPQTIESIKDIASIYYPNAKIEASISNKKISLEVINLEGIFEDYTVVKRVIEEAIPLHVSIESSFISQLTTNGLMAKLYYMSIEKEFVIKE